MRVWIYEAVIVRHVDGDTTVMDIDQGMNVWSQNQYVRYAGINAPEKHGPTATEGVQATEYLESLDGMTPGDGVWLATVEYHESDKYGRVLAVVYTAAPTQLNLADGGLAGMMPGSINQEMLDSGHAVEYNPSNL